MKSTILCATLGVALITNSATTYAADLVKIASAQRGLWTTTLVEFGQRKGIFKDAGIDLDIIWTDGGADAQQAIVTGSADIAVATGTLGAIAAWSRGAPVTILTADFLGGTDLFWYVRSDSPIKSVKDLDGKTVGYSRPGASSQLMAQAVVEQAGVKAKLVPSGNPAASLTAVMTKQIDVGWSAPPASYEQLRAGEIRQLFNGSDSSEMAKQTVRVNVANSDFLKNKPELAKRFVQTLKKTIDWAYDSDEAIQMWADMHKVSLDTARQARDQGYPRDKMAMKPLQGLDLTLKQALETKRINKPLTNAQVADLLKYINALNVD